MANYWLGDIPTAFEIDAAQNGEPVDPDLYPELDATLISPAGVELIGLGLGAGVLGEGILGGASLFGDLNEDGEHVTIFWPDGVTLNEPGLWSVRVTLRTAAGGRERVEPAWIVVQDDDGWKTLEGARTEWQEARQISDLKLWRLLEVSKLQVLAFAPDLDEGQRPPINYAEAQMMQAKNVWNAGRTAPSGDLGGDNFAITPFPLDWHVKALLRPTTGVPVFA